AGSVRGSAVGPMMIPAYEHLLCDHFAVSHPDAKTFLLKKLFNPNPYLAAYAFKCLIRLPDFERTDLPEAVLSRKECISVHQMGWGAREMPLGEFFLGYFGEGDEDGDEWYLPPPSPSPVRHSQEWRTDAVRLGQTQTPSHTRQHFFQIQPVR